MDIGSGSSRDPGPFILVTDGWLANAGDVASYLATVRALKQAIPGVRVASASHHRDLVGHLYPELNLAPPLDALAGVRWPWTSDADLAERDAIEGLVARADLALVPGGGNMIEPYRPEGRIRTYEELLARGKRLVFFSQSIGRFRDAGLRRRLGRVLEAADLVLVRDEPSFEIVREQFGEAPNLRLTADQAFLFGAPRRLARARSLLVVASAHLWDRADGESEMAQSGLADLAGSLTRMLEAEMVRNITIASTAQGLGPAGVEIEDDADAGWAVHAAVPANLRNRVTLRTEYLTPEAFTSLAAAHSATVSMRMHGVILAAVAGSLTLLANTSDKARSLSQRTGGRLAGIARGADLGRLDELLAPLLADRRDALRRQGEAVAELRATAETSAALVAERL